MKLQVGVKVLIKNNDGAFLFLRRSNLLSTDANETSWDIPGGRIDPGEQLLDALRREIKEEIGHDLQSAPELIAAQDILVPAKDLHVVRLTYIVEEEVSAITLSDEHDTYQWVSGGDATSIKIEPYLAQVLDSLQ